MLFSSWQFFFLFLPATLAGFFAMPANPLWLRKTWLLLASVFFYAYWKVEYVPLLLFSICFNHAVAEFITRHRPAAKPAIVLGVGINLLLLGYYKYTNFILEFLGHVSRHDFGRFDIMLPLAISFFTFTQIGYLVDVYRNPSLHHRFLDYAFFVVFFPHLIAGPIVRHWEIIPQFAGRKLRANRDDIGVGLTMFLVGLYKKVLLADSVSGYVATVYGAAADGATLTWFDAWLGTLAFAMQIYFDFSGYSDMAIGLARLFGIRFPMNFNSPYKAGSITEFWQRWHITLTRFLREYVYFPMGGNRCSPLRHVFNIMATMFLSGLWHGAGWTYIMWGGLHGFYLVRLEFKFLVVSIFVRDPDFYRGAVRVGVFSRPDIARGWQRAFQHDWAARMDDVGRSDQSRETTRTAIDTIWRSFCPESFRRRSLQCFDRIHSGNAGRRFISAEHPANACRSRSRFGKNRASTILVSDVGLEGRTSSGWIIFMGGARFLQRAAKSVHLLPFLTA
jgi:alginate O-acetyltransferase complex protein AlgI